MSLFEPKKPKPSPSDTAIEKRKFKRHKLDVPANIHGLDMQGNVIDEETFTLNVGLGGADIVSNCDYDITKPIVVKIHLSNPIGYDISKGDWVIDGYISRVENVVRTPEGKLKSQHLFVRFDGILGINKALRDPWKQ